MKIAVIGSGGREHAIVWKLCQHHKAEDIFFLPGNGGTNSVSYNCDINDFEKLKSFCVQQKIKLIIVGPEAPLANGIVDFFADTNIHVFGPNKIAAQLESSKIWAKTFMKNNNVATGDFWICNNIEQAKTYIKNMQGNLVIKYDGLAAGKGVYVCSSIKEANDSLEILKTKYGENFSFLIEEKLHGREVSVIGFTDGKNIKLLPPSQDYKRAFDGDLGPNTGGMGAICDFSLLDQETENAIKKQIINPTLLGLQKQNIDYTGVIYFGIMLTNKGPKLLEYNIRLGDPEAEVVLPALKSDLLPLIEGCLLGFNNIENVNMEFFPGSFISVVLASGGYPGSFKKGCQITGLDTLDLSDNLWVFHCGTKRKEDGELVNCGGRVLNVVSYAPTIVEARNRVYAACNKINFEGMFFRKDIGIIDNFSNLDEIPHRVRDDIAMLSEK